MNDPIEAAKETAEAVKEVAKTSGKAIDASREFGGFISRFVSGPLEQGMGIFEDKLKYMRWERQVRLIERARAMMADRGMDGPTKALPLKLAIPLLEAASLEDDDYLQDLWAKLLVNGASKGLGVDLRRVHIDILERLTPLEAQLLHKIFEVPYEDMRYIGVFTANLPDKVKLATVEEMRESTEPSEEVRLALSNLARLGCIDIARTMDGGEIYSVVTPTLIGKDLIRICTA